LNIFQRSLIEPKVKKKAEKILKSLGLSISTSFEPQKRAHSPLLAAGLASESKNGKLPYGRRFPAACSGELQLFYRQVIAQRGLPFELHVPNEKTMKAIENSRQGKGKAFSTPQELFDDLGI